MPEARKAALCILQHQCHLSVSLSGQLGIALEILAGRTVWAEVRAGLRKSRRIPPHSIYPTSRRMIHKQDLCKCYLFDFALEVLLAWSSIDPGSIHALVTQQLRCTVERYSGIDQVLPKGVS